MNYHCEDCIACYLIDHPEEPPEYRCKFDNAILRFNVETKSPCTRFHPEEYIRALNADSVTRD